MYGIKIEDLVIKIDKFELKNINLSVPKGTILGLVGRNGAGKTTLIKSIANCYKKTSGNIYINELTRVSHEIECITQLGIAYDHLSVNRFMKPKRLSKILEKAFQHFDKDFFLENLKRFNVDINKRLTLNSLGTNKKFSIILALSLNPKVLLLDEPTSGIDPSDKIEIIKLLQTFMEDDEHTILYSTHSISDLEKIADYIAVIDNGQIKFMKEKNAIVEESYLVKLSEDQINDDISKHLICSKKNAFGIEGLMTNKNCIDQYKIIHARPSIEQILVGYLEAYKKENADEIF